MLASDRLISPHHRQAGRERCQTERDTFALHTPREPPRTPEERVVPELNKVAAFSEGRIMEEDKARPLVKISYQMHLHSKRFSKFF